MLVTLRRFHVNVGMLTAVVVSGSVVVGLVVVVVSGTVVVVAGSAVTVVWETGAEKSY